MSVYVRNQPLSTDDLDVSQPKLATNTNASDDAFGVDHYAFSDTSGNRGFHNKVTQPLIVGSAHPTTTTAPIIYAMQDSSNLGIIQYSRGVSDAVPSPLTTLQSSSGAIVLGSGATTNVFDFTGLSRASGMVYGFNAATVNGNADPRLVYYVIWDGTNLYVSQIVSVFTFIAQASANVLQLKQASGFTFSNVYWTLQFLRTS